MNLKLSFIGALVLGLCTITSCYPIGVVSNETL